MFFRKRDERHDVEDIKEAMERPMEEVPSMPRQAPPTITPPVHRMEPEIGAPLFVKVEKYREILTTLHEMKLFVSGVKQLFTVLHELETVRSDAVSIMRATVQRLEKSMLEIDSELLKPRGVMMGSAMAGDAGVSHIEDTLTELQNQLGDLRKELQGLR